MKSISFIEELQREVVARQKTETRRLTDPQPDDYLRDARGDFVLPDGSRVDLLARRRIVRPRYEVGEIIYIKEPYNDEVCPDMVLYKYNTGDKMLLQIMGYGDCIDKPGFWRNKQSMPARLARYFLRITARHGERLQDITEEAAKREGVRPFTSIEGHYVHYCPELHFTKEELVDGYPHCSDARSSFRTLMEMIEGPGIWEKNPFVWVYCFEFLPQLTAYERRFYNLTKR